MINVPPATRDHPVWLHVGTLLDGISTVPAKDAHIVYDASGIRFVGRCGQMPPRDVVRTAQTTPDEIIRSVPKGLYAASFGGGQVDITNGKFVFSATEAYLIEDGKITAPVKGATLIGNGPDALTRVSMVGNDLELDEGIGTCGKDGQSVPVGVGMPTVRIDEMTVGGTQT